jgi:hypothetical protein
MQFEQRAALFSLPAFSAAEEAVDPNVLDFVWEGQHYAFEWRQVLLGPSLDALEWVVRRSEAIYGFDVIALFQLAGIAYPKDAENNRIIVETWGIGFTSRLKLLLHKTPLSVGLLALQALHHWLTLDKRAVAQYQAARYVNDLTHKRWDRDLCLIANFHFFYNVGGPYELVQRVYLRFFGTPVEQYNETQEVVFILMCRIGSYQDRKETFRFVDLDQHNYELSGVWEHWRECRDIYRAVVHYKAVSPRSMPADRTHKNLVHRDKTGDKYINRKKLLGKCCKTSNVTCGNSSHRLTSLFDYFLWCYLMGPIVVEDCLEPPPYVRFY